jgi:hypothetical protein
MSTVIVGSQLTLLELARRKDPAGNLAVIAEVLAQANDMIQDMPMIEANDTFAHKNVRRSKLPTGSWRVLNDGVARHASQTDQTFEQMGMLEDYAVTDKKLYQAAPNSEQFRQGEINAFLEGMSQTIASTVIYGNGAVDTEQFTGLAPRLNSTSYGNVYSAGGSTTTMTSVYIVQWGENKVHGIYPKGSKTFGINHTDLGEKTWAGETASTWFQAMVDHFAFDIGLSVANPKCMARICNIDMTTIATAAGFVDNIIQALNKMPQRGMGCRIYCNPDIFTMLDIYAKDKTNVNYNFVDAFGRPVMTFRGHPVRTMEAILNTETAIS